MITVLHIDDDPDTRLLVRELLVEPGEAFRLLEAGGVAEAVAQYANMRPDTILLDNRMGLETGLDLVPRIQQVWDCPVWILTGFSPEALQDRWGKYGAAGIIAKDELLTDGTRLKELLLRCF